MKRSRKTEDCLKVSLFLRLMTANMILFLEMLRLTLEMLFSLYTHQLAPMFNETCSSSDILPLNLLPTSMALSSAQTLKPFYFSVTRNSSSNTSTRAAERGHHRAGILGDYINSSALLVLTILFCRMVLIFL